MSSVIASGMSRLLAFLGGGRAECDDDGGGKIAVVAHAQREMLDAATAGEGRGLAMEDERAAPDAVGALRSRANRSTCPWAGAL